MNKCASKKFTLKGQENVFKYMTMIQQLGNNNDNHKCAQKQNYLTHTSTGLNYICWPLYPNSFSKVFCTRLHIPLSLSIKCISLTDELGELLLYSTTALKYCLAQSSFGTPNIPVKICIQTLFIYYFHEIKCKANIYKTIVYEFRVKKETCCI